MQQICRFLAFFHTANCIFSEKTVPLRNQKTEIEN